MLGPNACWEVMPKSQRSRIVHYQSLSYVLEPTLVLTENQDGVSTSFLLRSACQVNVSPAVRIAIRLMTGHAAQGPTLCGLNNERCSHSLSQLANGE